MNRPALAWIGALCCALMLASGKAAHGDEQAHRELMGRIHSAQIDQRALPDSGVLADTALEVLARRAFHSLAADDDRWNADNPLWQREFPQFRVSFQETVKRVVAEYELRAAMDSARALSKTLAAMPELQLAELDAATSDKRSMAALVALQQAAPLAIRAMGASALPRAYSKGELDAIRKDSAEKFGPPQAPELAERFERGSLKAYRERILASLTDTTELFTRLDSPVLRSELDALGARWRQRLASH